MSDIIFKCLSLANQSVLKRDMETFNLCADLARHEAELIGSDAYTAVGLALYSCIEDYSRLVSADRHRKSSRKSEYGDIHTWVRLNKDLGFIDGFRLKSGRVPDFISVEDGVHYPVECKIKFVKRSLNQLLTYMDEMGVSKGYAVASELSVELPDGIEFIEVPV